jgi:hypothetical protein
VLVLLVLLVVALLVIMMAVVVVVLLLVVPRHICERPPTQVALPFAPRNFNRGGTSEVHLRPGLIFLCTKGFPEQPGDQAAQRADILAIVSPLGPGGG